MMGSLPQHTIIEFRRYLNRFVYLFPDLSTMAHVLRSQFNQHEAFVEPLVAWLDKERNVNFVKGAFVSDIELHQFLWPHDRQSPSRRARQRPTHGRGRARRHRARDDRLAGRRPLGGNDGRTRPRSPRIPDGRGRLWKTLAAKHKGFGDPSVFFGDDQDPGLALGDFHGHDETARNSSTRSST